MSTQAKIIIKNLDLKFKYSYNKLWNFHEYIIYGLKQLFKKQTQDNERKSFYALRNINLEINNGDFVGVIGRNGAGKSTLLRTIAGIYSPDVGTVEAQGAISTLLSLGCGFSSHLNAEQNIRINALMFGIKTKEVDHKMREIIDFAELGRFAKEPLKYYSSGMISRLTFSIMVVIRPDILLLDEIFSVGDIVFQNKSLNLMENVISKASCKVLVSHNLQFIQENCNKIVYMKKGEIAYIGDVKIGLSMYREDNK